MVPVMNLMLRISPPVRQRDVRVALIVHTQLHEAFVVAADLTDVLQRTEDEAAEALDAAAECVVDGQPLLRRYKDVSTLSARALALVHEAGAKHDALARQGLLQYRRPDSALDVARRWLRRHDRLTSGDYASLTGLTQQGALRQLERLVPEGYLIRGEGLGRKAHFVAGPKLLDQQGTAHGSPGRR